MKNFKNLFILLTATIAFTACHTGTHVIITSDDNNTKIKLEYWGKVQLNSDRTALESISHNGYIDYQKNDEELHITNNGNGHFNYELNGSKSSQLDAEGRALLSEIVSKIAKVQSGH